MAIRKIAFAEGEYYHIYNRGNSKQTIFLNSRDYNRFQSLLYVANGENSFVFRDVTETGLYTFKRGDPLVHIGTYCLMPNHFHLLLTPAVENGVQKFMQKLSTSFSMYFNKVHERTGSLFEGRFKSQHAHDDTYLKYLFSYIHLNPVKLVEPKWREEGIKNWHKALSFAEEYEFSSLHHYVHKPRLGSAILQPEFFPAYYSSVGEQQNELKEWLTYADSFSNTEAGPM